MGSVLKVKMTTELRGLSSVQTGPGGLHMQRLSTFGTPPNRLPLTCLIKRRDTVGEPTSTFQDRFFLRKLLQLFAFKEGMYDTQIAAVLSSPTVSQVLCDRQGR
jgi:hypothetical protein